MMRFGTIVFVLGWLAFAPQLLSAAPGSYEMYLDWAGWARLSDGLHAGIVSSYARNGSNKDYSWYASPTGHVTTQTAATVATLAGPGIIQRFWMPHMTDPFAVQMFFDGEATPRIDTMSDVILDGNYSYFSAPLVDTCAGGQVCYEMIPFEQSLRIETVNQELILSADRHYYQYTYVSLPPGTPITSYDGTLSPQAQADRTAVVNLFNASGQHPDGPSGTSVQVNTPASSVPASGSLTLFADTGPGIIRRLNVRMDSATDAELDALRLKVTYDNDVTPAIDVAISHFFGAGNLRAPYASLTMGTNSPDGFYCYWPMPFRKSVCVELCNPSGAAIAIDAAMVEYESTAVTNDMCYLHVSSLTNNWVAGQLRHPIACATGRGHYVGNLLFVDQPDYSFRVLEGDEIITVDGTDVLYGTGLEDAYNGGFYYNWVGTIPDEPEGEMPQSATRPLNGILYVHREQGVDYARADQYRWYIADRVSFETSVLVEIETFFSEAGAVWTSVGFWYQQPDVPGDIDDDGDVDDVDRMLFTQVLLGTNPNPDHAIASDLNGDGTTDGLDIADFSRAMLNL